MIVKEGKSKEGKKVVIERHKAPDSHTVPFLVVRYGKGKALGKIGYFLETDACAGYVELMWERFLDDRDSLGKKMSLKSSLKRISSKKNDLSQKKVSIPNLS